MSEFTHLPIAKGIDLWHHYRPQVKSVVMRVTLLDTLDLDHAAANAMAISMLKRGTESYPSLSALSRITEDLYGTTTRLGIARSGQRQTLSLSLRFPSPSYIPQGLRVFRKIIKLAHELLFRPVLNRGVFDQEVFASEHHQLMRSIAGLKDNRAGWAMRRARECALPDSPFAISEFGSEESAATLTAKATTKAWRRFSSQAPMRIHVVGNFDARKHIPIITDTFAPEVRQRLIRLPKHQPLPHAAKAGRKRERIEGEREHSVLLYTTGLSTGTKEWAAMRIANSIFGRDSSSRLFRILREGEGLAYSITSMLSSLSGIVAVYAGTDADQAKAAIDGSKRILKDLQKKGVREEELEISRRTLVEEILAAADSLSGRISRHLTGLSIGKVRSLEDVEAELRSVRKAEVEQAFQEIRPLFTYRLGPNAAKK